MMAALARLARSVVGAEPAPARNGAMPPPLPNDKFTAAMRESDDLIRYFREASNDHNPIRAMMADLWLQRHNVPFVTAAYETVTEMKAATQYAPHVARDLNGK